MATTIIDRRPPPSAASQAARPAASGRVAFTPPTVTVNGVEISQAEIAREMQNHPAEEPAVAWAQAARALVVRALLLDEAQRLGITASPATDEDGRRETREDALVRALLESELSVPEADAETCLRYYERNRRRFTSPCLFEAAHILFAADRRDETAFAEAVTSARATIDALGERPGDFARMARELSACPSAANGGALGQVTEDQVTPEFVEALRGLEPGTISPAPVETRYGVHVIRLDRRSEGHLLPFETVRDTIAAYLGQASWHRAAAQYVALLAGRAEITGIDIGGADTPLVQ